MSCFILCPPGASDALWPLSNLSLKAGTVLLCFVPEEFFLKTDRPTKWIIEAPSRSLKNYDKFPSHGELNIITFPHYSNTLCGNSETILRNLSGGHLQTDCRNRNILKCMYFVRKLQVKLGNIL